MSAAEKKAHVVALAFPFNSHPPLLLRLVQRLAAVAPTVRFSYFNTAASNHKNFSNLDLNNYSPNVKLYDVDDGVPEGHVFSSNYPMETLDLFIKATPHNFRRRLKQVVEETGLKATCLLTDAFFSFSSDMAVDMGIPWVPFWTAGAASVSLHMYSHVIRTRLGPIDMAQNQDQKLDFLPGMSSIRATDLSPEEFFNLDLPFFKFLYNMSVALPRAAAVIINSFTGMDPIIENDLESRLPKVLNIMPIPLPPPIDDVCLAWLGKQATASVAYISFGTMAMPPPSELVALAEALEEKKIPYLWSFRENAKGGGGHLLQDFFQRTSSTSIGKVVEWAPQVQVLGHSSVGVFVTHCGWNSIMESVMGGVPMICRPFFGDQMINTRRVAEVWGIGVGVEGCVFTKSSVVEALDVVMLKEREKIMENIARVRECGIRAMAENGSSNENFNSLISIVNTSLPDS